MVVVSSNEIFNFLKEQSEIAQNLSDKDLVLAIFASQHLQGHHDFCMGTGAAATSAGIVISFLTLDPTLIAGFITAGCIGAISTCYNLSKVRKIKKMYNTFTDELVKRFPNALEAYISISIMIQSIERDEIIEYFNRANNN